MKALLPTANNDINRKQPFTVIEHLTIWTLSGEEGTHFCSLELECWGSLVCLCWAHRSLSNGAFRRQCYAIFVFAIWNGTAGWQTQDNAGYFHHTAIHQGV